MTTDERRLLELLARSADGCTDAVLTAQGFKLDVLISIVSAEFATVQPERSASRSRERGCRSPRQAGGRWHEGGLGRFDLNQCGACGAGPASSHGHGLSASRQMGACFNRPGRQRS
jgi:hypothetical protein